MGDEGMGKIWKGGIANIRIKSINTVCSETLVCNLWKMNHRMDA
jgi:hypothetical protein